jgi:hypothetical protein
MNFSELETDWHPTLNLPLFFDISLPKTKKYWWRCNKHHEWLATPSKRIERGSGCHVCSGQKVLAGYNDLYTNNPVLASEWHSTKNGELNSTQIAPRSNKKVWWLGKECGHEWEASPNNRAKGAGCPTCAGKVVLTGFNDLATINPILASEWHPTKNGELAPNQVSTGVRTKVWWKCQKHHEWDAGICDRVAGNGCPICSGRVPLIGVTDLATVNPILAADWHPTKNGELKPSQVSSASGKIVWWNCKKQHEWKSSIYNRTKGSGCPFCAGKAVLAGYNDLATHNLSVTAKWHPTKNGELKPTQVTTGSNKKMWWQCAVGHEWQIAINKIVKNDACPICSKRKLLVGFNDLATMNPKFAAEWHPTKNGELKPTQVTSNSSKKFWWQCKSNHEWVTGVSARTVYDSGCPRCANHISKAEDQIKTFLEGLGITVEGSNRTILGNRQEVDLWIPSHNVGIEFNGIHWHTEKRRGAEAHHNKYLAAQEAGIQLIQIWEDDWNQKPDLVKNLLAQKLGVAEKLFSDDTDVITVTKKQAEEFLNENYLQGYASGAHYLGLVSKGDIETLRTVLVLEEEPGNNLSIVRYSTNADIVGGFTKLLDHIKRTYQPNSFTTTADHCEADEELYENNGFIVEKVLPPDYMYVVKNERKDKSEYPLERFHSDPKLLWEQGLTEMELADLNGLDRIWDAGKTCYRLVLVSDF